MSRLLICVLALGACGGDDGTDTTKRDAAVGQRDAPTSNGDAPADSQGVLTVRTVACPGSVAREVTTGASAYSPPTYTINVNDIVRFTTVGPHDVSPHGALPTDPGLSVGFNMVVCKQFTATGTFNYRCSVHGFTGTATVN